MRAVPPLEPARLVGRKPGVNVVDGAFSSTTTIGGRQPAGCPGTAAAVWK